MSGIHLQGCSEVQFGKVKHDGPGSSHQAGMPVCMAVFCFQNKYPCTPVPSIKDLVGLIAEEVESVMPELVSYDKEGEPETVYYSKLVPLLLNEIIKLKSEMDYLKQKLE